MDVETKRECISEVAEIRAGLEEVREILKNCGKNLNRREINLQNQVENLFLRIEKSEQKLAA
jgi:hypothetical protein